MGLLLLVELLLLRIQIALGHVSSQITHILLWDRLIILLSTSAAALATICVLLGSRLVQRLLWVSYKL